MREVGVTGAQARLLMILAADEGRQQTHYASVLEVEPITLCRMVDRMVEADLIERSPDPNDRRARLLSRSDKARALEPVLQEKIDQLVDDIQSPFTSDELQILHRLLSRMGEQLVSPSEKITENKEVTAHG
ncbi:putative MarR family transcriptional regulator [Caenibius tardaugens NBRC 16725]|uniref:Putative MarR family transcriptional regulator n=2 Tax=Caenibius TaxID=2827482 RepID=U3A0J4_9SPHN|nr:putative MarR family transcriptional regulator [Caenibius tardaugens NBRC 16725]